MNALSGTEPSDEAYDRLFYSSLDARYGLLITTEEDVERAIQDMERIKQSILAYDPTGGSIQ